MDSDIHELDFFHLHIPVTINHKCIVHPSSPTPADQSPHSSLYLSNLDDIIGARDVLNVVLVPYYPLSSRLREVENGKLEVFFGEEQGVLMVSATSSMALAHIGGCICKNESGPPRLDTSSLKLEASSTSKT